MTFDVSWYDRDDHLYLVKWCRDSNLTLIADKYVDLSDFSLVHDSISTFKFTDEESRTIFILKWSDK